VQMMTVGEIDIIKASPRFAYGTLGRLPDIPPDSWIIYNVELLTIEPAIDYATLSKEARIQLADAKRQRGNYFFQRGEYGSAIDVYQRATKILCSDIEQSTEEDDAQLSNFAAAVYNNLAATQLKVDAFDAALDSLRFCINFQPDNAKAWYRRGKALSGKNDFEEALRAFEFATKLDPFSTAATQEASRLKKILAKQEFEEKNLCRRMFAVDGFGGSIPISDRQSAESCWNSIRQHGWWAFGATAAAAVGLVVYHMVAIRN